ncbi:MAG: hypothetical protein QOF45_2854, partial [Gaiellaceae bacterium]|nr:hypothetical protein [Gaiellaceae bacterium]
MHDDEPDLDTELEELLDDDLAEDDAELSEQELNGHTLSIRRADGEELV